ncbi:MAG: hypothetical protein AB1782_06480 [Cyanobacteriota bacterium]
MRIVAYLLLIFLVLQLNSCCCCGGSSSDFGGFPSLGSFSKSSDQNANDNADKKENDKSNKTGPLEYAFKMQKLQKEFAEISEKMGDPGLSPDEAAELEERYAQLEEEMMEISESMMDSEFLKNSKDPRIQQAREHLEKAKEMQEQVIEAQEQVMGDANSYPATNEDYLEFEDINTEGDSEFYEDVYQPEEF